MTNQILRLHSQAVLWALALAMACASPIKTAAAEAKDVITISSCPGQPKVPVSLQIDCSHLSDAATKELCRPFIENQACKVFPAYRKITGINLENTCTSIKFTIYEDANWPHPKGEGGLALNCAVDYLAKYSVQSHPGSKMGPYDVHELLHEYQIALGALPDAHVLFSSSMAEALREIGETEEYQRSMKNMNEEAPRLKQELRDGKIPEAKRCTLAETQVEESLYIENSRAVYAFYRKLAQSKNPNQADRETRFNRMFYLVSGPKPEVRQFLMENGCPAF
ncbi:MAG TPA: hypothetical protein VI636_01685 [Candidatus Angelobacter sp.]